MKRFFGSKLMLGLAAVLLLAVCVPVGHAKSGTKAEKQAQKIQKKLSHYKPGTLLHLTFNDNTDCTGTVNTLSDASFTFNNTDTNQKETHNYSDVSDVEKGKEYIGQGSTSRHRVPFGG
jgi:hypothetical protein